MSIQYHGLGAMSVRRAPAMRNVRPQRTPRLTQKDRNLLDLLAAGLLVKEADAPMFWADGVARQRLNGMRRKFGLRTTLQLMAWYARAGQAEVAAWVTAQ